MGITGLRDPLNMYESRSSNFFWGFSPGVQYTRWGLAKSEFTSDSGVKRSLTKATSYQDHQTNQKPSDRKSVV